MKKTEEPYHSIIDGSVYNEQDHVQEQEQDFLAQEEQLSGRSTKLCKKCKMDIPKGAKICPYCKSKQGMGAGGCLLVIILIIIAISIIKPMSEGFRSAQNAANGAPVSSAQPAVSPEEYMAACTTISFEELSRNPDKYKGQKLTFTGEVIQVMEPSYGDTVSLRINVTKGEYMWTDTIYAQVDIPKGSDRILEDDIITIYGECDGLYSYESVLGSRISLPKIDIAYFSVN